MSLFGSMTTAISGLSAQARALGNISDNVANSQTVGFKRTDTNFVNLLTESSQSLHRPGAVMARPDYSNTVQGTIEQVENPLALAIAGQGFFSVAQSTGSANGQVTFDERQFFTRAGDFKQNTDGYLVNGSGHYLQGWTADQNGVLDRTQLSPIRVNELIYNPVPTSRIGVSASLPPDSPIAPTPKVETTQFDVYDALGRSQDMQLNWERTGADVWRLSVQAPNAGGVLGSVEVRFGLAATPAAAPGLIGEFRDLGGGALGTIGLPASMAPGAPAELTFTADFGQGNQTFTLDLGAFGRSGPVLQYVNEKGEFASQVAQNGVPLGAFSAVTVNPENGDVVINYTNGQNRTVARVPVVTFSDPDALQRLDGQAFMRTIESGEARVSDASSDGAGKLTAGAVERSNVDIASEFSKLIVAQRAYTSNTRIVTASDEMLQDTINMRR